MFEHKAAFFHLFPISRMHEGKRPLKTMNGIPSAVSFTRAWNLPNLGHFAFVKNEENLIFARVILLLNINGLIHFTLGPCCTCHIDECTTTVEAMYELS